MIILRLAVFIWICLAYSSCSFDENRIEYQVLPDKNNSIEEIRVEFQSSNEWRSGVFNPGITPHKWWMKVIIPPQKSNTRFFFTLTNPHINFLEGYLNDSPYPQWIIGDNLPFNQRPYLDRDLVIPLSIQKDQPETTLIVKINKIGETLLVDPMLFNEASIIQKRSLESIFMGLIIGWMSIMFVAACFFAWKLNDGSSIFYALYILSITLWLSSHWGLGFQYLWPNNYAWADKSRPIFNLLTNVFFLLLMIKFFPPIKKKGVLDYLIYFFISLHLYLIADSLIRPLSTVPIQNKMIFLKLTFSFSILLTLIIITYLAKQFKAGVAYAGYYLAGISILIGFNVLVQLHQTGISLGFSNFIFDFGSSLGMLGETIFITAAFIGKAADYKKEREYLQLQLIANEKNIADRLINVQESERNRLARDLHDSIGGMLASIYLKTSQIETHFSTNPLTEELKDLVSKSIVEARSISHNLTPPHFEETGLEQAIRSQLKLIKEQYQLKIAFSFSLPTSIDKNLQLTIYRICSELIQNVLKHANASELMIHIMDNSGTIELIVEDDGKGYDTSTLSNGLGIQNIKDRVSYWKGKLTIDSTTSGTTTLIQIPFTYQNAK